MAVTIILSVVALAVLGFGLALIFGWISFKNTKGEADPFSSKEKVGVGAAVVALLVIVLNLLFSYNPPWLEKLKAKNGKA